MRRVVALVEIDGEEREMTFLTNNLEWSPRSVADLYRCRWGIEVFFKQIKQTLQLADFLGTSANAVRWQVWTALLTYVLLRYLRVTCQTGRIASPGCSPCCGRHSGRNMICSICWRAMGCAGGSFSPSGAAGTGVFPRLPMKLWDSTLPPTSHHQIKNPNSKISKSHFTRKADQTLANQRASTKLFPL